MVSVKGQKSLCVGGGGEVGWGSYRQCRELHFLFFFFFLGCWGLKWGGYILMLDCWLHFETYEGNKENYQLYILP